MSHQWRLRIGLEARGLRPNEGDVYWAELRGGPSLLLRWLETQLGLLADQPPHFIRVTQYANLLEQYKAGTSLEASFQTDRWATADFLLRRRDELLLAGWDGQDHETLPQLVRDLARIEQSPQKVPGGLPERLLRVIKAFDNAQKLPPHECLLYESSNLWPKVWREVLSRLSTTEAGEPIPTAPRDTALGQIQEQSGSGEIRPVSFDTSFRWLECRSSMTACDLVAHLLVNQRDTLAETAILCEDERTAILLDGRLANAGIPTTGATIANPNHPVLQVLPLALKLCWEPVDPLTLLDFLSLPLGPIPKKAARPLAQALANQPGFKSDAWNEAIGQITQEESDPEGDLAQRLSDWFDVDRVKWGEPLPKAVLEQCCVRVAGWSARLASHWKGDGNRKNRALSLALMRAAHHARTVRELCLSLRGPLTEPQLARVLGAALEEDITITPHDPQAGGPTLIRSLTQLDRSFRRLIWLGLGSADPPRSRWTNSDLAVLQRSEIDLDDGSRRLKALRAAERRGWSRTSESLLAISVPQDKELRPHPIWLQAREAVRAAAADLAEPLPTLIAQSQARQIDPWLIEAKSFRVVAPHNRILSWKVNPVYLYDVERSSATELNDRLACPAKWVFNYLAKLRSSPIASLPDSFLLKGTFCHKVLADVFGAGGELPNVPEAQQAVEMAFIEALPRNAGPLAQPGALVEKEKLRLQLRAATRLLVEALRAGNYQITAMEKEVSGKVGDHDLIGFLDCLARRKSGEELILDFKYGGRNKYRELLIEGRAIQLATYAAARVEEKEEKGEFPAVAYLILADGILYSPEGSAMIGTGPAEILRGSPCIETIWANFVKALAQADKWLEGTEPIPTRPLLEPDSWPDGVELVLKGPDAKGKMPDQDVCKYCDYKTLCGLRRLF